MVAYVLVGAPHWSNRYTAGIYALSGDHNVETAVRAIEAEQ
jgi:hypothetical protein